jgi:hypothetical protein
MKGGPQGSPFFFWYKGVVKGLVERVRALLLEPRHTLPLTLAESGEPRDLLPFTAGLAALGPIALFLSDGVIGAYHPPTEIFNTTIPGGWLRVPGPAAVEMLISFGLALGAWPCLAAALEILAPKFGGLRDRRGAYKAAAYALTPVWLAGALFLFGSVPYLGILTMVGLTAGVAYSVFLGMIAVPLHLGTPEGKATGHALAGIGITATVVTVVYFVVSAAVTALLSSRAA